MLRGAQAIKSFAPRKADAGRTYRPRFDAEGRPRGDYRVRVEVRRAGERVASNTVSRRL